MIPSSREMLLLEAGRQRYRQEGAEVEGAGGGGVPTMPHVLVFELPWETGAKYRSVRVTFMYHTICCLAVVAWCGNVGNAFSCRGENASWVGEGS